MQFYLRFRTRIYTRNGESLSEMKQTKDKTVGEVAPMAVKALETRIL